VRIDALSTAKLASLPNRLLHGRIFQAAGITMGAQVISQIIRLGGNLIMARLLAPEMFGLMSIVVTTHVILALLSDIGLRPAIIQSQRGDDPVFLNTVWTVQVLRGGGLFVACVAIALGLHVAALYDLFDPKSALGSPQLPLVLVVASISGVISSLQTSNYVTANRNLNLRGIVTIDLLAQAAGLIAMVAFGLLTRSIWALVLGAIVSATVSTALGHKYLPGIPNRFMLNREVLAEVSRFGFWILVSSITSVLALNLDRIYLGAAITATALGIYAIALNLYQAVDMLISRLFETVLLPVLSEASRTSREKLRSELNRLRPPFDIWYLGTAGMIYVLGPSIVHILYDQRYVEAGSLLQILSFALIFVRYNVFNTTYVAIGRSDYQAAINIIRLVSIAVLLPLLFSYYGLEGATYAVALHPIIILPIHFWLFRKLGLLNLKYEILVLPTWGLGYLAGLVGVQLLALITG